ncbi:hypothetical protein A2U01_0100957, partial [Trifolium medium]|nr:hypothetical protein [Trifolium medium]
MIGFPARWVGFRSGVPNRIGGLALLILN